MQLRSTQKAIHDGNIAALVYPHLILQTDINQDFVGRIVVVNDVANQTDLEAFHIDRTGDGNPLHVRKQHFVVVHRLKQVYPFQVINPEIKQPQANNRD